MDRRILAILSLIQEPTLTLVMNHLLNFYITMALSPYALFWNALLSVVEKIIESSSSRIRRVEQRWGHSNRRMAPNTHYS
jgi:hypothetical protein